jgi:hypothetical protein
MLCCILAAVLRQEVSLSRYVVSCNALKNTRSSGAAVKKLESEWAKAFYCALPSPSLPLTLHSNDRCNAKDQRRDEAEAHGARFFLFTISVLARVSQNHAHQTQSRTRKIWTARRQRTPKTMLTTEPTAWPTSTTLTT